MRGKKQLTAAARPVLTVRSPAICCRVQPICRQPMPGFVSPLLAGFAALELHTPCIVMKGSGLQEGATAAAAAWQLCKFFAGAPVCYERLSLCCTEDGPMPIQLASARGAIDQMSSRCRRRRRLSYNSLKTLAELMQHCANASNLDVDVVAESYKRLHVVRW